MAILICGGAGYVGSHNAHALAGMGRRVVVLDNLQKGHRAAVPDGADFVRGDIRDASLLDDVFRRFGIDAVMHFAADSLVGESMARPLAYFNNNVGGMQSLLEAMVRHDVRRIIFSSTAAVYGEPDAVPIPEDAPLRPGNPYGESKLFMERMMRWVDPAHGIRHISLRYFNVAGALPDGSMGEDHRPETHLIPLVLQVPLGLRPGVVIFGDDHPTPDGTCIRDYVGIMDLVRAHILALERLEDGGEGGAFNLGSGCGHSVREIVAAAERASGSSIPAEIGPRRPGDPARLVASAEKARRELGWTPRQDLDEIVASAWKWHRLHPGGYPE